MNKQLPELLAPCGDSTVLESAIANGADAIYLGLDIFNARIRAKNFTLEDLPSLVTLAHAHGVKVYITLNTQLYDKELSLMLDYVGTIYESGVDALIVADLGVASLIKEHYSDFEIHASTQCTVHNIDGADFLASALGFKRVVLARELPKEDIEYISKNAVAETEIFVHGAHCMSVSGQCLMSYAMGGRSGNRGECAQPCRLQYKIAGKSAYHLSLKDMSLSSHIPEIIKSGTASLKIEGRMKNSDYVGGTVAIYRKLLDEGRNATPKERNDLEALFSRQGFTDGYFTSNITSKMLGVRTDENKEASRNTSITLKPLKKAPISLFARLNAGQRAMLTIKNDTKSVTVYGDIVEKAINAPLSIQDIEKSLSKFGNTPYEVTNIEIEKSDDIMLRVSSLNALRRSAYEELIKTGREKRECTYECKRHSFDLPKIRTAVFSHPEQIPQNKDYFDIIYIYADRYKSGCGANGIYLPPVILNSEWAEIENQLKTARANGIKYALCSNVGQITRLKSLGFEIMADFRFNVFNAPSVRFLLQNGFSNVILSPELTLPQISDLAGTSAIVYGKIPVMTTHKCILKDTVGCEKCKGTLVDRQGAQLHVEGIFGHRNIIYNSVPIYMADRLQALKNHSWHFIFTSESQRECYEIIQAYKNGTAPNTSVKRIK